MVALPRYATGGFADRDSGACSRFDPGDGAPLRFRERGSERRMARLFGKHLLMSVYPRD
jgi:hypothetical protein